MSEKGSTPDWKRPIRVEVKLENEEFHDIDVSKLLVETKMVESRREAKRIIQQELIWLDNGVTNLKVSTIMERLTKVKLFENKFLLVERGDIICVGKTLDVALCHRIVFI